MKTILKPLLKARWSQERILAEARKRTAALSTEETSDNASRIQKMLDELVREAGWTDSEFIDALCKDVIQNPKSRLKVVKAA